VRVVQERGPAPALNDGGGRRIGIRSLLVAVGVAAAVVAADQLTKAWAVHRLAEGPVHVAWKLDFELTYNSGGAFSLAQGWGPVLAVVAVAAVLLLMRVAGRARSMWLTVALGLVMGGALGNLSDRLFRSSTHGSVVDFVALHFWPTFNVADACIVVGAVASGLLLVRRDRPG